jgi:hypothetical protein
VHGEAPIGPLECLVHYLVNHVTKETSYKVETPINDNIKELVTWECKEHGVKS